MKKLFLIAAFAMASHGHLLAQQAPPAENGKAFALLKERSEVDVTVPGSPAFALLDITPDKVQRPGTRRDFLVSLAKGLDQQGKPVTGTAFDVNPLSMFFREQITGGSDYIAREHAGNDLAFDKHYLKRILARTTISFGTTSAEKGSDASRSAAGIRIGLIDYADPGLYWDWAVDCLKKLPGVEVVPGRNVDNAPEADISACDVVNKPGRPLWAEPSLYAGYGRSWYSSTGKLQDSGGEAKLVWLAGSVGLNGGKSGATWRLLLQGYLGHESNGRVVDPVDETLLTRKDTSEGILRLKAASNNYAFFVDWGGKKVKLAGDTREYVHQFTTAFEYQIWRESDTWIQVAAVNEKGFANGKDKSGVTFGLKFGPKLLDSFGVP